MSRRWARTVMLPGALMAEKQAHMICGNGSLSLTRRFKCRPDVVMYSKRIPLTDMPRKQGGHPS